jgi:hypothetical protein
MIKVHEFINNSKSASPFLFHLVLAKYVHYWQMEIQNLAFHRF